MKEGGGGGGGETPWGCHLCLFLFVGGGTITNPPASRVHIAFWVKGGGGGARGRNPLGMSSLLEGHANLLCVRRTSTYVPNVQRVLH